MLAEPILSAAELDAIDARARQATPGPWETVAGTYLRPVAPAHAQNVAAAFWQIAEGGGSLYPARENAAFLAASRSDVPASSQKSGGSGRC